MLRSSQPGAEWYYAWELAIRGVTGFAIWPPSNRLTTYPAAASSSHLAPWSGGCQLNGTLGDLQVPYLAGGACGGCVPFRYIFQYLGV